MVSQKYRWDFIGLSTDEKPTSETSDKVVNGSTYYCSDTSKLYVYCDGTWYERKPLGGGGGGGGTSNFNQLTNRPKYNGATMTGSTDIPEVKTYSAGTGLDLTGTTFSADTTVLATKTDLDSKQDELTAGDNVTIEDESGALVISATDTTYSNFTGTDGTSAGEAGLVPAPATTDAGKFLKADGTWDTAGGGSGPTVVQTTGASTTDVMSQNAVSTMVFKDPSTKKLIAIGDNAQNTSTNGGTAIGANATVSGVGGIAISGGWNGAAASATGAIRIGGGSNPVAAKGAISLGYFTPSNETVGKIEVGSTDTTYGYNSSNYRLLSGLYDPQSAHDAATKGYVDAITLTNAGAPTTATVGTVGQLLEDTTNGKLYICTAVTPGTAPDPDTYTWVEVGAGGGSVPTVVQTTGTSTTDVMSQNAVTSMVFADPATQYKIKIGAGTSASEGSDAIEIGRNAAATGTSSTAIGPCSPQGTDAAKATHTGAIALGTYGQALSDYTVAIAGKASAHGAIAIGWGSQATAKGQFDISTLNTSYGYNNSLYRLISGVHDPVNAHDAATKGYVDPTTDSSAPTTATVGRLGQIYIDTTNADAYMCVAVDTVTPSYTWKKITA